MFFLNHKWWNHSYDITSGSVYFKGQRICAGTKSYKDAIAAARREKRGCTDKTRLAQLDQIIADNRNEIKSAKDDHKNADRKLVNEIQMIFCKIIHGNYCKI